MKIDLITKNDLDKLKEDLLEEIKILISKNTSYSSKKWLTEVEAMKYLNVSKSTIQRYRRNGLLPFSQERNKIYIKQEDIFNFLNNLNTRKDEKRSTKRR